MTFIVFTLLGISNHAHAQDLTVSNLVLDQPVLVASTPSVQPTIVVDTPKPVVIPTPPPPVVYAVVSGDNLTRIAEANNTSWLRLWQKNTFIVNPNLIYVDNQVVIPLPSEVLADRPIPGGDSTPPPPTKVTGFVGSVAGNTYDYGFCTWYVKNRRPDIPNNWGDAMSWLYNAQSIGWPTGITPKPGSVGTAGDHVVYVEAVNQDGTVLISEMNYNAWNVVDQRTVAPSAFTYIY